MQPVRFFVAILAALCFTTLASAQQTTGTLIGKIVDEQGAVIPGATVSATNPATGFNRVAVSDAEGIYRLNALPVGDYDLIVELAGFAGVERKGVIVNVGQTLTIDFSLRVATVAETVQVVAATPLIESSVSSVGGVVDLGRIESIPLNGRQFANLAATLPGVGLGNHSDPTKSTQYAPQINGGNGRNVNYLIDGGDNNDDTVGGLLQLFPLEAIQEFNFVTSRAKAENGRSNGGVINVVTKSGTNTPRGSFFTLFRDDAMNAKTTTEKNNNSAKQNYRRYQYGGSFGGPIKADRAHYFGAVERTQQDTFQIVNTRGLATAEDGTYATPYRETLLNVKVTANLTPMQYMSVRYGRNENSQPYGAAANRPPSNWGDSTNGFNSINLNHNWVLGGNKLNEFIFQYADFLNDITARSRDPLQTFPNGVAIGQNVNTPQSTQQKKWQFRNDFSWHVTGMGGVGHDIKTGVNFINEPTLHVDFSTVKGVPQYVHLTDSVTGPISTVTLNEGDASANIPLKQYAFFVQDDWAVSDKLTLNVGLRYDLITGYQFDQSKNPNFVKVQDAGRAGQLAGIKGMENFGQEPKDDTNNWQPRVGFAYDVRGDGKDVIRGGWGIYMDMAYTNANALFPAIDATGVGFGAVLSVDNQQGIRNPDGSLFQVGQPLTNIASQNQANPNALPLFGQFTDPRLQMPYTRQASIGWSHELAPTTVFTADFVRADGRDLNVRPRINTRIIPNGPRVLQFLNLLPNAIGTRPAISRGESKYTALITGLKRRMTNNIDFGVTYTLAEARSQIGTASDELNANLLQDSTLLYDDPRVYGPTSRTDARHSGSLSMIWMVKGFTIAPTYFYRSPLPVQTITGRDENLNGENNDLPARAYQFTEPGQAPEEIGACETWNCSRGAWKTQMNLRVSRSFGLGVGSARLEAIAEVFNLLNAKNPNFTIVNNQTSALFMQPDAYAGDFQQSEQRVGQIGFRFSF
ncbi:MAG TPA: TonB-dependent receptor [Vicinamibacterales bacterium]|nr:TonB-dependent receptor [Vicinamibacterales bacterium]